MSNYSDSIIEMLKNDEGYVGLNNMTRKSAHKSTSSSHGAYYDAKGYLTAGFGSLISKNKKGSIEEAADIELWKERTQLDPFSLDEEQATRILPQDIDRTTARAKRQLGDVDFETLPEQAQQAVVSLAFNAGQIGENTAAAIRKAAQTSSTKEWQNVANKIRNWHGSKAAEQPLGVLARREREAKLMSSIEGLTPEGSDSETLADTSAPDGEMLDMNGDTQAPMSMVNDLMDVNQNGLGRSPAANGITKKDQLLPAGASLSKGDIPPDTALEDQPVPEQGQVKYVDPQGNFSLKQAAITATGPAGTSNENVTNSLKPEGMKNAFGESAFEAEKSAALQAKLDAEMEADQPWLTKKLAGAGNFQDHLTNTFLTENIVGSNVRKWMLVGNTDNAYKQGFDATELPDFKDVTKDIEPEKLKEILDESLTPERFYGRVSNLQEEERLRTEVSNYMATDPIAGFVGIGVASAADITSLIPVAGIAKFVGVAKAAKGIPMVVKTIGGAIGTNLMQDLTQEILLTENSDVRKWDDGDILYGAVGSIIMGGAAGTFKYSKGLAKYDKLATKYNGEKNLSGIEMLIRSAESKGHSPKIVGELKKTRAFIEQTLERDHRAMILKEITNKQEEIGKGLIDTSKLGMVKELNEYNTMIDARIAVEKTKPVAEIVDAKLAAKEIRAVSMDKANKLRETNQGLRNRINQIKSNVSIGEKGKAKIEAFTKQLDSNNQMIDTLNAQMRKEAKLAKKVKGDIIKDLKKGETYSNPMIKELEQSKQDALDGFKARHDALVRSVTDGTHPELQIIKSPDSLTELASSLGLGHLQFKNMDDIDKFLGLEFEDTIAKSAGAAATAKPLGFLKGADVNTFFNRTDADLWSVISGSHQQAMSNPAMGLSAHQVAKDSYYARVLRSTKLNEFFTTDSTAGKWILNKSALRTSDNEFAKAFYNLFAPDGVGRAGEGRFSVIEKQQQLSNIFGGKLRSDIHKGITQINDAVLANDALRSYLQLPQNDVMAKVMMAEVGYIEKVSNILRDELITPQSARQAFGDHVGDIVETMSKDWDSMSASILEHAKRVGVLGVDEITSGAENKGWFHRTWDNPAVRQFHARHGEDKLIELVNTSMVKQLTDTGIEVTDEIAGSIATQSKKFAFGIFSSDLEVNRAEKLSAQEFINGLILKNLEGVDGDALRAEAKRLAEAGEAAKLKELGRRKPLSLNGSVEIRETDGSTRQFFMKDLLEKNILLSQKNYIESMSARIAAAENGIKDIDSLDQWASNAVELEMARGNKDTANYIKRAMSEDIRAFKYGAVGVSGDVNESTKKLLAMTKKYQFAKLMQYTGISSIAEMGTLIPEAGYKAISTAMSGELTNIVKSLILGGITGKEFTNKMYDGLSSITGVGLEDIGYDSLLSSSNALATTKLGRIAERTVDNLAKTTKRATAHIEVIGRRLAVNSLALNFGDIAMGRSQLDNLLGGLSNRNLVELGLADLDNYGKAVTNDKWNSIITSINKLALDEDGNLASVTGKNIKDFNISKWDLETRRTFGDALTQQANHIMVNPDSTTAKLWHSTAVGSIYNQFRTFSNNAASKIAGHNVNQAIQGYKMGSMAEFSKTAQKYFWGAALGKLSLILYGSINNAGREDFSERMEKYMHMNDPRDWTQALGRSSAITGLDEVLDTTMGAFGQDPLFNSSTIGQSRSRFDIMSTPTGQMLTDAKRTGGYVMEGMKGKKGSFGKAGKTALKMSPIRRQIGVNQLLNAMGVD